MHRPQRPWPHFHVPAPKCRAVPTNRTNPDASPRFCNKTPLFKLQPTGPAGCTSEREHAASMIASARGFAGVARSQLQCRLASSSARPPWPGPKMPRPVLKGTPPRNAQMQKPLLAKSSPPPPPPPPSEQTLLTVWRTHWLPLTGSVLLACGLGFYLAGTIAASLQKPARPFPSCSHETPTGRPPALDGTNAEVFDKELDFPEWWMGITKLRKRLAAQASGHVLELAVGSGRNLQWYDWDVLSAAVEGRPRAGRGEGLVSFTGLDISVDMLDVARRRILDAVPPMKGAEPVVKAATMADHTGGQLSYLSGHLRLIHSDAHRPLPPPPSRPNAPSRKYDTIIQTFGLCSVSDPVSVLTNLASAVKPETGRIILLEHGQGWYGIVNGLLDKNADKHFDKYGCWWNRDIEGLVEEAVARTPGLEVVKLERPNITQMGTLVWVELRMVDKSSSGHKTA